MIGNNSLSLYRYMLLEVEHKYVPLFFKVNYVYEYIHKLIWKFKNI